MSINSSRGQSFIELIMILPIFIAFWAAFVWFAHAFIIKIELLNTARHGIFWLAYNRDNSLSPEEENRIVHAECLQFLQTQNRSIDLNRVGITVEVGDRWEPIGPAHIKDLFHIFTLVPKLGRLIKASVGLTPFEPARVRLEYQLPTPSLLCAIPGFPKTVPLRGYCVCYR